MNFVGLNDFQEKRRKMLTYATMFILEVPIKYVIISKWLDFLFKLLLLISHFIAFFNLACMSSDFGNITKLICDQILKVFSEH